jgi:hypothetical protein
MLSLARALTLFDTHTPIVICDTMILCDAAIHYRELFPTPSKKPTIPDYACVSILVDIISLISVERLDFAIEALLIPMLNPSDSNYEYATTITLILLITNTHSLSLSLSLCAL